MQENHGEDGRDQRISDEASGGGGGAAGAERSAGAGAGLRMGHRPHHVLRHSIGGRPGVEWRVRVPEHIRARLRLHDSGAQQPTVPGWCGVRGVLPAEVHAHPRDRHRQELVLELHAHHHCHRHQPVPAGIHRRALRPAQAALRPAVPGVRAAGEAGGRDRAGVLAARCVREARRDPVHGGRQPVVSDGAGAQRGRRGRRESHPHLMPLLGMDSDVPELGRIVDGAEADARAAVIHSDNVGRAHGGGAVRGGERVAVRADVGVRRQLLIGQGSTNSLHSSRR